MMNHNNKFKAQAHTHMSVAPNCSHTSTYISALTEAINLEPMGVITKSSVQALKDLRDEIQSGK